jgi:DNA repair photolyase
VTNLFSFNWRLPRVVWVERHGSVLHPTTVAGQDALVLGLNITRGCVHRCPFCSVRASPNYPGNDEVFLFANTADRLETELAACDPLPRAVYLSPATDPFPPITAIQDEVAEVVRVLARHGVAAWLMTRGLIRSRALAILDEHRSSVRITQALTTTNRDLQRLLEPLTAPPRLRLGQIQKLRQRGIPVHVALDPLIPELTDTHANLEPLLAALADLGVTWVTTSYMFLREGIRDNLLEVLTDHSDVLATFRGGPVLATEGLASARYLPRNRRQRGYARLMALASRHGISVSVSQQTNPDFAQSRSVG